MLATELPELRIDPGVDRLDAVDAARERGWIFRTERGFDVISYEGCLAGFQSTQLAPGVQRMMRDMGLHGSRAGRTLTNAEGAEHTDLRRVLSPWFTPRRIAELADRCDALVAPLVAGFRSGDDVMTSLAARVPGPVFCWMIGAPLEWADRLVELSAVTLLAFKGDPADAPAIRAASKELAGFVRELADAKATRPGDDLMTVLQRACAAGQLTEADTRSLAFELLSASTDNTITSVGLVLSVLAERPDQWQRLREEPALVPGAVEEALRVRSRILSDAMWARDGATLLGVELPPDAMVWLDLEAAHHDPAVFEDPRRFDVARVHLRPQLNFGFGKHYCLGAALARMELASVLGACVRAWSAIRPSEPPRIVRGDSTSVGSLRLDVTPAA
jgi:cytochrome P450